MEHFSQKDLEQILSMIRGADQEALTGAADYVRSLAAPPGSMGKLTGAAIQLAGITGKIKNTVDRRRIIVFCADNGVVEEGVSVTPQIVTLSQAINMTRHLTGMASMAEHFGCEVEVVDVGIASPYLGAEELQRLKARDLSGTAGGKHSALSGETDPDRGRLPVCDKIVQRRIRRGTRNLLREPAMTRQETLDAIGIGIERARQAAADGIQVIGAGEMGIGNTTTSSAVLAALTGSSVEEVTGRGGGLTDTAFLKKKKVIRDALALHHLMPPLQKSGIAGRDPVDILSKVGGLDLAAMCGSYLGAALCRIPVVIDGIISIVAALCAQRLCSASRDFMFPSHLSDATGYMCAAQELGLDPWLHMNMRLGEGSGCPLAFQILEAACVLMNDMATFEEAAIDDGYLEELRS